MQHNPIGASSSRSQDSAYERASPLSRTIRLLGSDDRGSPISPGTVYNLLYDPDPGWIVGRVTDGGLVLLAPDGAAFEVE